MANTVAAANKVTPEERLSQKSPSALKNALPINIPGGDKRWTTAPANCRPTAIRPVIQTSTRMPETPAF